MKLLVYAVILMVNYSSAEVHMLCLFNPMEHSA